MLLDSTGGGRVVVGQGQEALCTLFCLLKEKKKKRITHLPFKLKRERERERDRERERI